MSSRRRVEACDSWRPPRSHGGPALLLRAGPRLPAFASLSVREGGEAAAVAKAVEEAVVARAGEGREEQRAAAGAEEARGKKERRRLPPAAQLVRHPLALLALVPHGAALFAAGAAAGAAAKTVTAPLDRVKILMQTHSVRVAGESAKKAVGFLEVAMRSIASLSSI
ncbi:putative envelope ADP,ATP carrier protein, chloroplastic [Panicum miliaceum]|uniref:Envelope ADP,ATP carrier protein, chloroplastic n=1 Tax=Panicum miliaceum TaxID=4540 RepID=A0A3L6R2J4_PANMI|nr:putative envelope ADP,ATP carrier protein, chloroplastic [Panicum miliaceum]